jgi:methylated-DNA-protein-cysteine methyltransferase-like protein
MTKLQSSAAPNRLRCTYDMIYAVIQRIPRGRVATYGQIAELAGIAGQPRRIGYALSALTRESDVPWHRVLNAKGEISLREGDGFSLQRKMLEQEGIVFDKSARVSLDRFQWRPR